MFKKFLAQILLLSISSLAIAQQLNYSEVKKFDKNINTSGEESHPIISVTGDTLFFSRTNYNENTGGRLAGSDIWYIVTNEGSWSGTANNFSQLNNGDGNAIMGIGSTKNIYLVNTYSPPARRKRAIAYTKKEKGKWISPLELDLKLDMENSYYSFYIHPDEDVIIISMKMDDSEGLEDLYVTIKNGETWGKPLNIGKTINTDGYEISPFLTADKDSLFFASNGHKGLGDADIYFSTRIGDGWQQWSEPANLGAPVNSKAFDAYYIQKNNNAYFSSNRDGNNDLYSAKVKLAPVKIKEETVVASTKDSTKAKLVKKDQPEKIKTPEIKTIEQKIYFAFDSDKLNSDSKEILNTIILQVNKSEVSSKTIVVSGYTDSFGPDGYNQKLGQRRAAAVKQYFISKGISPETIEVESKGETEPAAANNTEEGRKRNRRVEVFIELL